MKKSKLETDSSLAESLLRMLRNKLTMSMFEFMQLVDPETHSYLKSTKLIDYDYFQTNIVITPKGYNWDMESQSVKMPEPEPSDGTPAWQIRIS